MNLPGGKDTAERLQLRWLRESRIPRKGSVALKPWSITPNVLAGRNHYSPSSSRPFLAMSALASSTESTV